MITIVGLGVERGDITQSGKTAVLEAAKNGAPIFVRTAHTASYLSVLDLGVEHTCLDYVYERSRNFATLAKNLAKEVLAGGENAVYLVDGAPTEDNSVKCLLRSLRGKAKVLDGVSRVTSIARKAFLEGCSYTAVSAYELLEKIESGNIALPLIVYDLDDRALASDCKLALLETLGEEIRVKFIGGEKVKKLPLYELDRQKSYDYSCAIAIEEVPLLEKTRFTATDLQRIIRLLRAPNGCPWDRVQTNDSIKMSAVEEAYELVDAVDLDDDEKIMEEAGDILLQAVFHAVIKEEQGAFTLTDVLSGLCQKLIFRHSHVFGTDKAESEGGALSVWEKNKMVEKHQETFAAVVNDVPKCFPAAMRAQKVGKRAAKAGMDFVSVEQAASRIQEELAEFFEAYQNGDSTQAEKELGDLLFAAVNVGRKAGCDCEKALKESVERFAARFTLAEQKALSDGREVTSLTDEEWDTYYRLAKKQIEK